MRGRNQIEKLVVFRRGLLGDILVSVPAIRCLREAFPDALMLLVGERSNRDGICWGSEVLQNSELVNEIIPFDAYNSKSYARKAKATVSLLRATGITGWDLGICLDIFEFVRWEPTIARLMRCRRVLVPDREPYVCRADDGTLKAVPQICVKLLEMLRPLGIAIPDRDRISFDLHITGKERDFVNHWVQSSGLASMPKPWFAVGAWANMAAKQWPVERFRDLALRLNAAYGGTPIFFGGLREGSDAEAMIGTLGFGISVAGRMQVRESYELLRRCALFVGNDSGAMHLAAAAGIPCVAIFSGRDAPGLWSPFGTGHIVLRRRIECEGCMLRECSERQNRCLIDIETDEVYTACVKVLSGWSVNHVGD